MEKSEILKEIENRAIVLAHTVAFYDSEDRAIERGKAFSAFFELTALYEKITGVDKCIEFLSKGNDRMYN